MADRPELDLDLGASCGLLRSWTPGCRWPPNGRPRRQHRVGDNLPGTPRFCPIVLRTPALDAASSSGYDRRAREVIGRVHRDWSLARRRSCSWRTRVEVRDRGRATVGGSCRALGRGDRAGRHPAPDPGRARAAAAPRDRRRTIRPSRPAEGRRVRRHARPADAGAPPGARQRPAPGSPGPRRRHHRLRGAGDRRGRGRGDGGGRHRVRLRLRAPLRGRERPASPVARSPRPGGGRL